MENKIPTYSRALLKKACAVFLGADIVEAMQQARINPINIIQAAAMEAFIRGTVDENAEIIRAAMYDLHRDPGHLCYKD